MMTKTTKRWTAGVSASVLVVLISIAIDFQRGHYANAGETEERSIRNEEALVPIRDLVQLLGDRQAAEDAKLERDAELCRAGIVKDCAMCARAGERLEACAW